ncbi:DUF4158 domain-containing protein [Nonomuraea sp. NPDC050451]|uniref:DUF4158 domain-containing protein n=1 Tax=Nonomuraea sp. NPDC050451 TaxID=3364364 RepID=UPI0037AB8322
MTRIARLIGKRRGDHSRLGFALQVVTVRHLGMFLADPLDVPVELVDYLAEQLDIEDPSCVKQYTEREKTKLEHAWEIQQECGLSSFAAVESELSAWIADQAWVTGDGPKAILEGAIAWLRDRRALLPGIATLERLVAEGRQAAVGEREVAPLPAGVPQRRQARRGGRGNRRAGATHRRRAGRAADGGAGRSAGWRRCGRSCRC